MTQFRLRFDSGSDMDGVADYLKLYMIQGGIAFCIGCALWKGLDSHGGQLFSLSASLLVGVLSDLAGNRAVVLASAACLVLGVSLVAAGGGLYRQVADALRADARLLFGGDVEVEYQQPLPPEVLAWMQAPGEGGAG